MNWLNNKLFIVLFIGGGTLSCVVRTLSPNPIMGAVLAIFICLFCLCWYFNKALLDRAELYHSDNVYYLGLLFTLVSLVYSLVTLFIFNSEKFDGAGQTHDLIGSFGIALISTIFGILFRVLLLQQNEPQIADTPGSADIPDKNIQSVYQNLAETAFKLRMELTQTIADMSVFRQAVIQASNETVVESNRARAVIISQMEEAANEQSRILSTLSTTVVDRMDTSVKHIQESLDDLISLQTKKVQDSIDLTTRSTEQLDSSIRDSLARTAETQAEIQTASSSVTESLQSIVSDLNSTTRNVETLTTRFDPLYSGLQQTVTLLDNAIGEIAQATTVLPNTAITFSDSLTQATKIMPQYTQQLEQLIKILREGAEQWQSINPVSEALQSIVSDLQSTARNAETLAARFDPLHSNLQQALTILDDTINGIKQAAITLPDTTRTFFPFAYRSDRNYAAVYATV